jgi:hypothetical protein
MARHITQGAGRKPFQQCSASAYLVQTAPADAMLLIAPSQISTRARRFEDMLRCEKGAFSAKGTGFSAFEKRSVVNIATYFIGAKSKFLGTHERQRAAKELVRNLDSKFVVVLPLCRYDLTMKKKIKYVLNTVTTRKLCRN